MTAAFTRLLWKLKVKYSELGTVYINTVMFFSESATKLRVAEAFPVGVQSDLPLVSYYRDSMYKPYINSLREELLLRFDKHHQTISALQLLIPAYYGKLIKFLLVYGNFHVAFSFIVL